MKSVFINVFVFFMFLSLYSCSSATYYQVYQVKPIGSSAESKGGNLVFEDANCIIYYNMWGEGGNVGFRIYNKSEKDIYLNLEQSSYVFNGMAYDYYKGRVYEKSSNVGVESTKARALTRAVTGVNSQDLIQTNGLEASNVVGVVANAGSSVSYKEAMIVRIPSRTSKIVKEYSISSTLYRDCDLLRYPLINKETKKFFEASLSPIVFSNRIAYSVGADNDLIRFENSFYVSEISNYHEASILISTQDVFCGQKSMLRTNYISVLSPDRYYLKYKKGNDMEKY